VLHPTLDNWCAQFCRKHFAATLQHCGALDWPGRRPPAYVTTRTTRVCSHCALQHITLLNRHVAPDESCSSTRYRFEDWREEFKRARARPCAKALYGWVRMSDCEWTAWPRWCSSVDQLCSQLHHVIHEETTCPHHQRPKREGMPVTSTVP
jgi:hypothetical protein